MPPRFAPPLASRLALAAAGLALCLASLPVRADPVADFVAALPDGFQGLTRLAGPEDTGTAFVVVRESARDRIFILREGAAPVEVAETAELPGRIAALRSEADAHGVVAFVDLGETTYELFLENDDPTGYLFQPASN